MGGGGRGLSKEPLRGDLHLKSAGIDKCNQALSHTTSSISLPLVPPTPFPAFAPLMCIGRMMPYNAALQSVSIKQLKSALLQWIITILMI